MTDYSFYDRDWRHLNLYTVMNKQGCRVPYRPNRVQCDLLADETALTVILQSRQVGSTTHHCLDMLDRALFSKGDFRGMVISDNVSDGWLFLQYLVLPTYAALPWGVRAERRMVYLTEGEIKWETPGGVSTIQCGTSMCSVSVDMLYVSQFGCICHRHPERAREIMASFNNVPRDGTVVIDGTAMGYGNKFHDMCRKGDAGKDMGDSRFLFFPWYENPDNASNKDCTFDDADIREVDDYCDGLEKDLEIRVYPAQREWYLERKEFGMGWPGMKREYPSTVAEAWEGCQELSHVC